MVTKYQHYDFIPLRIENAFDAQWWASVSVDDERTTSEMSASLASEGQSKLLHLP